VRGWERQKARGRKTVGKVFKQTKGFYSKGETTENSQQGGTQPKVKIWELGGPTKIPRKTERNSTGTPRKTSGRVPEFRIQNAKTHIGVNLSSEEKSSHEKHMQKIGRKTVVTAQEVLYGNLGKTFNKKFPTNVATNHLAQKKKEPGGNLKIRDWYARGHCPRSPLFRKEHGRGKKAASGVPYTGESPVTGGVGKCGQSKKILAAGDTIKVPRWWVG